MKRSAWACALLVSACFTGGCARVMHSYDLAPNGLTRTENGWRTMLAAGRADTLGFRLAYNAEKSDAPGDELLRLLYLGTAAHYGRDYTKSNEYLEAAAALSDDRITKSLSRSALSLISNDGVLPYLPSHSERLLIPYYAAMNYIALGRMEDAAVEARRLAALLEADKDETDLSGDVRSLRSTLRSFTGTIFEAAGHRNDALVAYRNAVALGGVVDTSFVSRPASADSGSVVVMLENGFVAHRIEQNLFVWLGPDEMHAFSTGGAADERAETATSVAARVANAFGNDRRDWGRRRGDVHVGLPADLRHSRRYRAECVAQTDRDDDRDRPRFGERPPSIADVKNAAPKEITKEAAKPAAAQDSANASPAVSAPSRISAPPRRHTADRCRDEDDVPYLLKVAWPVYTDVALPAQASLVVGADTVTSRFANLSGAVVNDFGSQLPLVVARTVARGAAKAALTESVKRKASEKNEGLGKLLGLLGNAGNVILERADTRSWHLLPAGVAMVRVQVPAGTHNVQAVVNGRVVDVGAVQVERGGVAFATRRVW